MRPSSFVLTTAVLLAGLASLAGSVRAEDLPAGYGTNSPSGSTFTSDIAAGGDTDDYAFQGFPGMVLTATVKPAKGSALIADVQLVRPGGSIATDEDGVRRTAKGSTLTMTMPLDAAGWWQVRVRGKDLDPSVLGTDYSAGGYTINIKYTSPVTPALPLISKGFTVSTDIDSKFDTDDYRFPGYEGQTLTATLKIAKGSHLLPGLSLNRPDGTEVADPGVIVTKGTTVTVKFTMDQAGIWKMRVRGLKPTPDPDPNGNSSTTGPYSIAVKLGKVTSIPSIVPDGNNQYRFSIPAVGGATVAYTLGYVGAAPTFNSLTDPTGAIVPGSGGGTSIKSLIIPATLPIGNYTLTFDAPATPPTKVTFSSKLTLKKGAKALKKTLSGVEPFIFNNSVNPTAGGGGTPMTITVNDKTLDPNDPDPSNIKAYLGHTPLLNVSYNSGIIHGTVPVLPLGVYDVIVESSTGQVAAKVGAFTVVSSPTSTVIDPNVGTDAGGFPITITGTGYRPGRMGIQIDGRDVPVNITDTTETSITFIAPSRSPTTVTFGVIDLETRLAGTLQQNSFEYVSTASISRVVPSLTTVLGGDTIYVKGANFAATDTVYIENNDHATYQSFTGTYLDKTRHVLLAPPRNKGTYKVYVQNSFGQPSPPKTRNLTYFQFTKLAGALPTGADGYDGVTNATADYDKDGYDDFVVSRVGTTASGTSLTRVLHNDGATPPHFTDVTSVVMPAVTAREDWRANRTWLTDVTQDGYPDLLLVTDDSTVLASNASHLRILVNEARGGGTNPNERVFRDHTADLLQSVRISGPLYGGSASVVDNWRALDMWIGDVDRGPPGPPEILITHKDLVEELDVGCGAYCASPYASGYTYGFYWGGSRAFVWDKSAKGGEGMYRFERNFFPRKSGVRVSIFNPPAGVTIPICNSSYGHACRGLFTPFIGKRITAGDLDADGKPDVAVLSDGIVQKDGQTISSLQVGMNKFNSAEGSLVTDVTSFFTMMGGDFKGDTVEIGQPGYPDGNSYGVIAMTKASGPPGGGVVMRILTYKKPAVINQIADFEDISSAVLPLAPLNDRWQASRIIFRDIDSDGDQDMIMVCDAPPGGTDPAYRVMRNESVNQQVGVFRETLKGLITSQTSASDHLEAEAMSIGDVNKDGTFDFVLSRAGTSATPPQTRVLIIDK